MQRSDYDKKNGVIGKMWEKSSNRGPYMTGYIVDPETEKETQIVVWSNKKRPGKNDPDWQVCISKPREETDNRQHDNRQNEYQPKTEDDYQW